VIRIRFPGKHWSSQRPLDLSTPAPAYVYLRSFANVRDDRLRLKGDDYSDSNTAERVQVGSEFCVLGFALERNLLVQSYNLDTIRRGRDNTADDHGEHAGECRAASLAPSPARNWVGYWMLLLDLETPARIRRSIAGGVLRRCNAIRRMRWWRCYGRRRFVANLHGDRHGNIRDAPADSVPDTHRELGQTAENANSSSGVSNQIAAHDAGAAPPEPMVKILERVATQSVQSCHPPQFGRLCWLPSVLCESSLQCVHPVGTSMSSTPPSTLCGRAS